MDELLQAWIHGTSLPPLPGAEWRAAGQDPHSPRLLPRALTSAVPSSGASARDAQGVEVLVHDLCWKAGIAQGPGGELRVLAALQEEAER